MKSVAWHNKQCNISVIRATIGYNGAAGNMWPLAHIYYLFNISHCHFLIIYIISISRQVSIKNEVNFLVQPESKTYLNVLAHIYSVVFWYQDGIP